jgi:mono/diheme cytochrome c family protein
MITSLAHVAALATVLAAAPAPSLPWIIGPDDGQPTRPPPPASAELRTLGRSLYQTRCARCHGEAGDGKGPAASKLDPRPTDFVRAVFKVRSTPAGALPTDQDLFRTITRGMHGTAMEPWRLTETERWALVHQVKAFSSRWRREPPVAAVQVPLAPRETDDIKERGEALYVRLRCGSCHGDSGAGDGPGRDKLRASGSQAAAPRDFTRGRFIRGAEMEDIYLTLKVGIEGTPMAAYPSLGDGDLWALAAYVRQLIHERPLQDLPPARTLARE